MSSIKAVPTPSSFSRSSSFPTAEVAPKKKPTLTPMRLDIALHPADTPPEPGAISIDGAAVNRVAGGLRAWLQTGNALRGLLAGLPALIGDLVNVMQEIMSQLALAVVAKGRTLQQTVADVVKLLRA